MPWLDEQARLTQEARLLVAGAEEVYRELKQVAEQSPDGLLGRDDAFEARLVDRNLPLINLGLATFGTNEEVFKALYNHSLTPARDDADAEYKRGLRIGCLSNTALNAAHFLFRFPRQLIGETELNRLLMSGEQRELEALLCNPSIEEGLLEELYTRTGPFVNIPEGRWATLLYVSRRNERIGTEREYSDSPDMGHYGIHKAIFRLLEIAPVQISWIPLLYGVLDSLNFMQVRTPEAVEPVLKRWSHLDDADSNSKLGEGYFTGLSLKEEFCCLIASLYGRTYSNNKFTVYGSPTAKEAIARCAYYGNANLTEKEMKAGYERDKDAFVFAAMNNTNVFYKGKLRKLFEEEMVWGDMTRRYLKNFELAKKKLPQMESYLARESVREAVPNKQHAETEHLATAVAAIERQLNGLTEQVKTARHWIIIAAIAVAAGFFFKH